MLAFTLLLIIGCAHGCYLSLALHKHNQKADNINLLLSLLVINLTFILCYNVLEDSEYLAFIPQLIGLSEPSILMIGPLFYLYVKKLTSRHFVKVGVMHFIPAIAIAVLWLPFYFSSVDIKFDYLYADPIESDFAFFYDDVMLDVLQGMFFLQTPLYLWLVSKLLIHHKKSIVDNFSSMEKINLHWLIYLTALLSLLYFFWFADELIMVYADNCYNTVSTSLCEAVLFLEEKNIYITDIAIVLFIYLISFYGLHQPGIFNRQLSVSIEQLEQQLENAEASTNNTLNKTTHKKGDKYLRSPLIDGHEKTLFSALQEHIATHRPYLDPDLSLEQLCEAMQISRHYLSQAINQCAGKNFFDFINGLRITEAKKLLLDQPSMSVLTISLAAGFNSRSAFYSAFKKHTDVTPSQFRRNSARP